MADGEWCKLKYRSSWKEKCHPYLATLANNCLFKKKNHVEFACYRSSQKENHKILVATTDKFDYFGTNYSSTSSASIQTNKFYLGVLKKSTMRMKLYDTEMFQMKPLLGNGSGVIDLEPQNKTDYFKNRKMLTSIFGSKAKKRMIDSQLHYEVEDVEIDKSFADASTANETTTEESTSKESDLVGSIPPQNKNAVLECRVYDLNDIITEEELNELEVLALEIQNATHDEVRSWSEDHSYSHYVVNYLQGNLPNVTLHKSKLLILYSYMVQFYDTHFDELAKKDPFDEYPDSIKSLFLKKFVTSSCGMSGNQRRSLTYRMKDKLIVYAVVIALFIEDFVANITVIQRDFRITKQRMTKIAQALGCYVIKRQNEDETVQYAQLRIPLYTPREKIPSNSHTSRGRWAKKSNVFS